MFFILRIVFLMLRVLFPVSQYFSDIVMPPCHQVFHVRDKSFPQLGERVFHTWRNFRKYVPVDQAVGFEGM